MIPLLFAKAQNPGYTRKDGTYVKPFNDRRPHGKDSPFAKQPAKWGYTPPGKQSSLFGGEAKPEKIPSFAVKHPKPDERGHPKMIHYPTSPSSAGTWESAADAAVFTPGSAVPTMLNGVLMLPWEDAPADDDWDFVDGQNDELVEPKFDAKGKKPASGVIIQEPDGRVWLISPTNRYGGVMHTFPKGGRDEGLSLQSNAIKEAYEESGLQVEIDAHAIDVVRSTSVARYYFAHRVGGSPADMGWESQAVRLVPLEQLGDYLNRPEDREILEFLLNRKAAE